MSDKKQLSVLNFENITTQENIIYDTNDTTKIFSEKENEILKKMKKN